MNRTIYNYTNTTQNITEEIDNNNCVNTDSCLIFIYIMLSLISCWLFLLVCLLICLFIDSFVVPCFKKCIKCWLATLNNNNLPPILRDDYSDDYNDDVETTIFESVYNFISKLSKNKPMNTECAICLDNLDTDAVTLKCNHGYHEACFQLLLEKNLNTAIKCPMCRDVTNVV